MGELDVELRHGALEPLHTVEDLDGLCVGVEPDFEWSRHAGHPTAELLLGVVEAVCHVVDWLVVLVLNKRVGLHGYRTFQILKRRRQTSFHRCLPDRAERR